MDARTKASVLWGVTGALAFLVLAQAYVFFSPVSISFLPLFGVAVVVFAGAAVVAYYADRILH